MQTSLIGPSQLVSYLLPTLLIAFVVSSLLPGTSDPKGTQFSTTQVGAPVLISQATSTRAIALESVAFTSEPFVVNSPFTWATDRRTRIILFALNLTLDPPEDASVVSADGEDSTHRHYAFQVEYVGAVPGQEWMKAVVVRLSDDLTDVGDVLVRVKFRGLDSNRVRVGIGHIGGGLPDDPGAAPTPAPPYTISGNVSSASEQLTGVTINLTGPENRAVTADANGNYSFSVNTVGDYQITAQKPSFAFTPASRSVVHLTNSQPNLNFVGVRQGFTIAGQVTSGNQGLPGIILTLRNQADGSEVGTTSAGDGRYLFASIAAGSYSLKAGDTTAFTFQPPTVLTVNADVNLNFTGTRLSYAIGGRVVDRFNRSLSGLSVELSGGQNTTAITDSRGNYSFNGLPAGFGYTVTPSPTILETFPAQTVPTLTANEALNFNGVLRTYRISGRIRTTAGVGAGGVRVNLSGTQNAEVRTAGDGSYAFDARVGGTYTITPSIEQGLYSFSPFSEMVDSLFADQTVDFSATLNVPSPQHVLEFDGTQMTVDYGNFWPAGENLGHFFWEFWARPDAFSDPGYLVSDGYGGAHSLLFGAANFNLSEPGRHMLLGDINDGVIDITHVFYFGGDQGPAPGQWAHLAVGWDGRSVICYYDGVPVGKMVFSGPRQSPGPGDGGGRLLIGGSDHLNFKGRIAQVRGYEGSNPREDPTGADPTLAEAAFAPETLFSTGGNLLSYYFQPANTVADLSNGYGGIHRGTPRGTTAGVLEDCGSCPAPRFVIDPTAPNFVAGTPPAPIPVAPPLPLPSGALVFDSFSRLNSTYTFGSRGGLGATEGGLLGTLTWQNSGTSGGRLPFGILNGRAVMLANNTYLTWIPIGGWVNVDISVDRHPGQWQSGIDTGLSFRVQDASNYFFAYTGTNPNTTTRRRLTVGYKVNGQVGNILAVESMPESWTTLRVVTLSGGRIDIYADTTLVSSVNSGFLATTSAAGLYNNSRGLGLTNRWDNFTISPAH